MPVISKTIEFQRDNKEIYRSDISICNNNDIKGSFSSADILSSSEIEKYHSFPSQQRKDSFLCSRYVAKTLIARTHNIKNLKDIEIRNGVFGYPLVFCDQVQDIYLSISHNNQYSAAIISSNEHPVSIDLESFENIDGKNIRNYFTKLELEIFSKLNISDNLQDLAFWTAKESLSKVLRTGLTLPLPVMEIESVIEEANKFIITYKNFGQYKSLVQKESDFVYSLSIAKRSNLMGLE